MYICLWDAFSTEDYAEAQEHLDEVGIHYVTSTYPNIEEGAVQPQQSSK